MTAKTEGGTKLDFNTQYSQFYICDKTASLDQTDDFWSEDAFTRRLALKKGVIGVGTECYGPVKGEVIFLQQGPDLNDFDAYDHVVEGNLEINSGVLQIQDCPNGAVEFERNLENGIYRVRVYSMNLASVEGDEGDDFYRIEVWRCQVHGVKLLKEYKYV